MDEFRVMCGRGLLDDLDAVVRPPYVVVTMENLWDRFRGHFGNGLGRVHFVTSLDLAKLEVAAEGCAAMAAVIGLGGGQALDVAKFFSWRLGLPLFQVPTALSVNAAFAHRAGVRDGALVRYVGWSRPEAVWLDLDVIRSAPPHLNWCGASDILCYHTAHWDWQYASRVGRCEQRWPYDAAMVEEAARVMQTIVDDARAVHDLTDEGVMTLSRGLSWGGCAFANSGWNPRAIEGSEHFVFYALESVTGRRFIHGQAVGLGTLLMSALQDNRPEEIRLVFDAIGIPYRPAEMGVTWDDTARALRRLPETVKEGRLWYTVASDHLVSEAFIDEARDWIDGEPRTFDRSVLETVIHAG